MPLKKNLCRGCLSYWCDADVDADADTSKQYINPTLGGGSKNPKIQPHFAVIKMTLITATGISDIV